MRRSTRRARTRMSSPTSRQTPPKDNNSSSSKMHRPLEQLHVSSSSSSNRPGCRRCLKVEGLSRIRIRARSPGRRDRTPYKVVRVTVPPYRRLIPLYLPRPLHQYLSKLSEEVGTNPTMAQVIPNNLRRRSTPWPRHPPSQHPQSHHSPTTPHPRVSTPVNSSWESRRRRGTRRRTA